MTLCACGCGQEIIIKRHHKWKGIPKYIKGHYRRGKKVGSTWMKGRQHKLKSIKQMSKSHKGKTPWNKGLKGIHLSPNSEFKKGCAGTRNGKHNTEAAKKKLSVFRKNYYLSGNKPPMFEKHHTKETKEKMSLSKKGYYIGKDNPRWCGGISFEPYCHKFNDELKERIRIRDNRICQRCGVVENGKKLAVHHVHYDKPNCEPDLIALCNSCNSKVNNNRDYWETYFTERLAQRGLITKNIFPIWWES